MNESYTHQSRYTRVAKDMFYIMSYIDGAAKILASSPNTDSVAKELKNLDIFMINSMSSDNLEALIALQASNGLKLKTHNGLDVFVIKSSNVEQVGRKIAKLIVQNM